MIPQRTRTSPLSPALSREMAMIAVLARRFSSQSLAWFASKPVSVSLGPPHRGGAETRAVFLGSPVVLGAGPIGLRPPVI